MPVSISEVKAAVDGEPVSGAEAPETPLVGGNRGPDQAPGRNNRFGVLPRSMAAAGSFPEPGAGGLRPAFSAPSVPADQPVSAERGVGGGGPPSQKPPGGSGPGDSGPRGPRRFNRRRLLVVAAAVGVLGLATYAWALAAVPDGKGNASPAPTALAGNGKCVVSYAVYSDDGERFKATVTVANRDYRAIKNWNLWFIMQGDQVLSGAAGKVSLDQQGTAVTVKGSELLSPQKSKTMTITGRYAVSNKAPMVFQLGTESCATYVSEKPGAPSKPVVRLSGGGVGLGAPVKDNPIPGITVGANGIAIPVPVVSSSPPPGSSPSPSLSSTPPVVLDCNETPEDPACPPPTPPSRSPSPSATTDPPIETTPPTTPPAEEPQPEDTTDIGVGSGGSSELVLPPG
jgi:serine/threonine-protein kinase